MLNFFFNKRYLQLAEVIIILTVLISGYILFAYERENHNPDYNKNWVAFYFVDANNPQKGVTVENHMGIENEFRFCLIPDSDDLMEPNDLSCSVSNVEQSTVKDVKTGENFTWNFPTPISKNKYWAVLEYRDGEVLKDKDLSFKAELKN